MSEAKEPKQAVMLTEEEAIHIISYIQTKPIQEAMSSYSILSQALFRAFPEKVNGGA